jgi:cystathionine beta-lyase
MMDCFDRIINRKNTASVKWDETRRIFGRDDLLPMWIADMDFLSPQPVIEALKKRAEHGVFGYSSLTESYFAAIENWMKKRHGWTIQREWICTSPGVVTGISLLVNLFSQPGDRIIIQPPVYYPFFQVIKNNGREVVLNALTLRQHNGEVLYEIDFDDFMLKIRRYKPKMFILCSPHNPVGRVWTKEELKQLGEICLEHDVLVIADEIHADIVYPNHYHIPFALLSKEFEMNSITCVSPSKTFNLAGLQTSVLLIPNPELRKAYLDHLHRLALNSTNLFGALALEYAYRYGEDWLDQLLIYLNGNVQLLTRFISDHLPQIMVIKPQGTYLVWLDCRGLGMDDQQLERFMLNEARVALRHGYLFGPGGEGFVRINIACPRSMLQDGLKRIEEAVNRLNH